MAAAWGIFAICLAPLHAQEDDDFRDLFDGNELSGWTGGDVDVKDGLLLLRNGITMTKDTFANYEIAFDFRHSPAGQNGIAIHYPGHGNGEIRGIQYLISDHSEPEFEDRKKGQGNRSLASLVPTKQPSLRPLGEWNHQRISVIGSAIKVEVNGEIMLRANLDDLARNHPHHEDVKRRAGHIALFTQGSPVAYRKIRIREIPPTANVTNVRAQGFQPLFNGTSLEGWKHDENTANWLVINGILKHTGEPGETVHLWSENEFGDFTLAFDWRWSGRGEMKLQPQILPDGTHGARVEVEELDSGVFVRGNTKSQVNLWNWTVGSGEVWGYRTAKDTPAIVRAAVTPRMKADRPIGEWNRMMIRMKGDILNVVLNGKQVIENAQLPGIPERGAIGLQHHGQAIEFANMWIKED